MAETENFGSDEMIEQSVEIICNDKVSENTFLLKFRSRHMAGAAEPGQFVMVQVAEGSDPLLRRPFSICGVEGGDTVLLLYKKVGTGTGLLSVIGPGRFIDVLGPLGRGFSLPGHSVHPVLVSGGIGAAPLAFLARSMGDRQFRWFAGYRAATEIVPFSLIGIETAGISISTDDGSSGHSGFVTGLLENGLKDFPPEVELFACGPAPMLRHVASLAAGNSIPAQFSVETAMACGLGACQGCTVHAGSGGGYRRVCVDGPVFNREEIDWSRI